MFTLYMLVSISTAEDLLKTFETIIVPILHSLPLDSDVAALFSQCSANSHIPMLRLRAGITVRRKRNGV